jgi:hypothetical protein
MLLYKSWLDTRWRFLIGLALLVMAACAIVFSYQQLQALLSGATNANVGGALGAAIEEARAVQGTYRGFVWSQWFEQNSSNLVTLFAALLGSGSALSTPGRGLLFTLALPLSRGHWLGARAATGLAELFALALVPSLAIALLSPVLIGEHYAFGDALVHGICVFVAGSVFFGTAMLLSTMFNDVWRPLLLTCLIAIGVRVVELIFVTDGLFAVMSAESYFLGGSLPWIGLLVSALLTLALMYAAAVNVARRDF